MSGRLNTFVPPRPSKAMIAFSRGLNRTVMLAGIPLLRDVPWLNRHAPFRGLSNVRTIDFPAADEARLRAVCGEGRATFFTPNHPEFFTDWMIDKEILSRVSPMAASWATNAVVNGMGGLAQKFWLANNLIAQIPGNSAAAREHSIRWTLKGHGVLLHPEGGVGWHGNHVDQLMPGAAEMALEALERSREAGHTREVWLAPVVWKLKFQRNVEAGLLDECAYVERRLSVRSPERATLPGRVFCIYRTVLARDADRLGLDVPDAPIFSRWHYSMLARLCALLGDQEAASGGAFDPEAVLRGARRELRDKTDMPVDQARTQKELTDCLAVSLRLAGSWAFSGETITQEEIAEHIKRLRNDYCKGTMRDTLNAFVPQPAGPRTAHIRAPDPIAVHDFRGDAWTLSEELHRRMQQTLDRLVAEPDVSGRFIRYRNPFYPGLPQPLPSSTPRVSRLASAG